MKNPDVFDSNIKISFFSPMITSDDKRAVMSALDSVLLTDGPKLRQFEEEFAKFVGAKYAVGVSNATSALHLSLKALGIGRGDEVIVPDMTFVATANAVVLSGATPVFADIDEDTMNISIDSIKKNISSKTKAILPVHFAGLACDMTKIRNIAKQHNLRILEDCAHAIGTTWQKKHVGNFGDAGCFSFYPTKNMTTIEGGMVITNSKKIAKYVMLARNHGLTKTLTQRYSHGKPWDYDMKESGYNYRLDEIRSALGLSQLKTVKKLNGQRRKAFEYYNDRLQDTKGIIIPQSSHSGTHSHHLYILRIRQRPSVSRDIVFAKLLKYGIKTSVHYKPLHKFSAFKKFIGKSSFTHSEKLYKEIISLPFYPNIPRKHQDYVIECLIKIINGKKD